MLTAVAVAAAIRTVAPPAPATVTMTVAARDLAAGDAVSSTDLTTARVPPGTVPDGAVAAAAGSVLATPVRRGEPITDVRLVGPALTTGHPGLVALPVRLPDGAMVGLLDAGDRIDLYAVASSGSADAAGSESAGSESTGSESARSESVGSARPFGEATRVAAGVLVLAVPAQKEAGTAVTAGLGGRLIVIGVPERDVARVTDASVRSFLAFAFVH